MNAMLFPLKCTQLSTLTKSPALARSEIAQARWVETSSYHTEAEKKECSWSWDQTCPKDKVVLKILSPLNIETSSRKLVAVQICLQACMVYSGICCQGIYHLSPTLSESRGVVINCSGNANSVNHSGLLSTQHGSSSMDPRVRGTLGPK